MMHSKRTWCVAAADSAEDLARRLTEQTWTLCTAFELHGYLFLNDATCEDGAQEYAVVKRRDDGTFLQVESITFSWCSYEDALEHIRRAVEGRDDANDFARVVSPRLESPEEHGRCPLCA